MPKDIDLKYPFAPRETMRDVNKWNELISLYRAVDWGDFKGMREIGNACEGVNCETN